MTVISLFLLLYWIFNVFFTRATIRRRAAPTHRDSDVAQMARQALFPKKINRDGTHSTIFPAVQALTRLREGAMTDKSQPGNLIHLPERSGCGQRDWVRRRSHQMDNQI